MIAAIIFFGMFVFANLLKPSRSSSKMSKRSLLIQKVSLLVHIFMTVIFSFLKIQYRWLLLLWLVLLIAVHAHCESLLPAQSWYMVQKVVLVLLMQIGVMSLLSLLWNFLLLLLSLIGCVLMVWLLLPSSGCVLKEICTMFSLSIMIFFLSVNHFHSNRILCMITTLLLHVMDLYVFLFYTNTLAWEQFHSKPAALIRSQQ